MAITRAQVRKAVERYLPRTVNFAHTADLGDRDTSAIFRRIKQIILTNLLVDPDAVFYIIYLSSQRLLTQLELTIALLDLLMSTNQLRGITGEDPSRIEDYTQLSAAQTSLVRLSTGLAREGAFGDEALDDFQADIKGFMEDQVVPNVSGGNRTKISADMRATMESLKEAWAVTVARREKVFGAFDKYIDEDLRVLVATDIISAVQTLLQGFNVALPNLTTDRQAENAEQILVELAAADAAIVLVGNAPDVQGSIVAGPGTDGRTLSTYRVVEGRGRTEPLLPLLQGVDGKLRLTGPSAGAPFVGELGRTVAPGVGVLSDSITDSGAPSYVTAGVVVGMYITFVDLGYTAEVTGVTPTTLTFSPSIKHRPGEDLRYAVTDHTPGEYFQSPGTSFWTEHTLDGQPASNLVTSAAADGAFVRVNKAEGGDGTNIRTNGTAGELFPLKASGNTSYQTGAIIRHSTATWLTDGVLAGNKIYILSGGDVGEYTIVTVDSETQVTVTPATLGGVAGFGYRIYVPGAQNKLYDPNATFLTDGVVASDKVRISGKPDDAVVSVDSQTTLTLGGTYLTPETSRIWEVIPAPNVFIFSSSVNFLAAGVQFGDKVKIVGEVENSVAVVGQHYLELDVALSTTSFSATAFEVYTVFDNTVSTRFVKAGGLDFDAAGVGATMTVTEVRQGSSVDVEVQTIIEIDGIDYTISRLDPDDPADTLTINPLRNGRGNFTSTTVFIDDNADWQAAGVDPAKHELVIRYGTNAVASFPIATVDSETQITISGTAVIAAGEVYEILPKLDTGLDWSVYASNTTRHIFSALDDPFTVDLERATIVFRPGEADEIRTTIDTYIAADEVWLSGYIPDSYASFDYAIIDIVRPGQDLLATAGRYDIVEVADENTVKIDPKLSNAPGENIAWQIVTDDTDLTTAIVYDPDGADVYDSITGFDDALIGLAVELVADRPISGVFVQPYDPGGTGKAEAFIVDVDLLLGYSDVSYRIMSAYQYQSDTFLCAEETSLPVADDLLAVWEQPDIYTVSAAVSATPDMSLTISPPILSGLVDESYVVTRGGGQYFGRYTLYSHLNGNIELEDDTALLRLTVAEVLIDFGEEVIVIDPGGADGVVANDGDDDGVADVFTSVSAAFAAAHVGDRLTVTYPGPEVEVTFVTLVMDDTTLRVDPPLTEGTGLTWVLERNSVSASLEEASKLRGQLAELRDLVQTYFIPLNPVVEGVLSLLHEQRLNRAVDLLYDGDLDEFVQLGATEGSYSTRARVAAQGAGADTFASRQLSANIAGVDPATGKRSPYNRGATSSYNVTPFPESVDARIILAEGVSDLLDDELMRSLFYVTDEEQRNRAIYVLGGFVESGFISDTDPTLPWIKETGSLRDRTCEQFQKLKNAVQYMIDHPDEFDEADLAGSLDDVE